MSRDYQPGKSIDPRVDTPDPEPATGPAAPIAEARERAQEQRGHEKARGAHPGTRRSIGPRRMYAVRGRTYRLRDSEIATMVEVGKFRAIDIEDLSEFVYSNDSGPRQTDVKSLFRKGLIQIKSIPHEEKGARELLALTKAGYRFLTASKLAGEKQALHFGFVRPRDAHHDADLYRVYQKAAEEIERAGGRNLRVVLDYELMKGVHHDLAKLGPDRAFLESKRDVAERHGLKMVDAKIPLPDVRIEYDTAGGERARVNIELATRNYCGRSIAEKALAGFSIYARAGDVSNLRRVLDQRELTAEILSL